MLKYIIAALLVLTPVSVQARETAPDDGNELMEMCTSTESFYEAMCLGYIRGSDATLTLWAATNKTSPYCAPSGVTIGQLLAVVKSYLAQNPALLHQSAPLLVLKAQVAAWPCNKIRT